MNSDAEGTTGRYRNWRWPLGPVRTMLMITVALSALFLLFPGLDVWFSGLFYDPDAGFPAARVPALRWLRQLADAIIWAAAIAVILSVLVKLMLPDTRSLIKPRAALFLGSTLIVGPGLLVNGLLKANWGRPRPIAVEEFGGYLPFVEVWRISGLCDGNCSLVSGEASSAIWLLALALVVPIAWRNRVAAATLILAAVFSINRVAFGAHLISDVVLSWALTLLVVAIARHFLFVRATPGLSDATLEERLAKTGRAIRRFVGPR